MSEISISIETVRAIYNPYTIHCTDEFSPQIKSPLLDEIPAVSGEWKFAFFTFGGPLSSKPTGNCYTFNKDGSSKQIGPFEAKKGLTFKLKRFRVKYDLCYQLRLHSEFCENDLINFHSPSIVPRLNDLHNPTIPFFESDKTLNMDVYFRFEHRIQLPKPHGDCIDRFPQQLMETYPIFKSHKYDKGICEIVKFLSSHLLFPPQKQLSNSRKAKLDCPIECDQLLFEITGYTAIKSTEDFFNFTEIKILSQDLITTTIEQTPEMSVPDLLGNIGGLLGLYLGASMLSVFEFFEFVMQLPITVIRDVKAKILRRKAKLYISSSGTQGVEIP